MKETKIQKGQRLKDEGRIHEVKAWRVEGDNDTYIVAFNSDGDITCTCPTQDVECSHMIGVALKELSKELGAV